MSEISAEQDASPDAVNQTEAGNKAGREAAKYRTRLREVETERDEAKARAEALATKLIEHQLPKHVPPKLFWHDRSTTEFFKETGEIDLELLNAKIKETAETYGLSFGPYVPAQRGSGGRGEPTPSFDASFAPRKDF